MSWKKYNPSINWRLLRILGIIAILAIGMISIQVGFVVGALLTLCIQGAKALLPRQNPFIYWPIGLLATLLSFYSAYLFIFYSEIGGLTPDRAVAIASTILMMFTVVAAIRVFGLPSNRKVSSQHHWSAIVLMLIVSGGALTIGIHHFYFDRVGMIAGYLSGGDHGLHIEFIADMMKDSGFLQYTNPLSLHDYPKGIHFLVANLVLIGQSASKDYLIVQEHLVPALFEYVQLAAFLQLVLIAGTKIKVQNELTRTYFVAAFIFAMASVDKLGNHLFWSGFTTSLALSWILLVPIAVCWEDMKLSSKKFDTSIRLLFWLALAIAVWITYQPYVLIPLACFAVEAASFLIRNLTPGNKVGKLFQASLFRATLVAAVVGLVSFLPFLVQGRESLSVQRLLLFGVTWRIPLLAVIISVVVAIFFVVLENNRKKESFSSLDAMVFGGVTALTLTIASISAIASDVFSFWDAPYYVQKMYWVLFFLSAAISLKWATSFMDRITSIWKSRLSAGLIAGLSSVIFLVPVTFNRSPIDASKHIAIDWFAKGMFVDVTDIQPYRAAVFNTWENLGAHVGNIALRRKTDTYLSIDIAQSRNPYWACWTMRRSDVNVIYTAGGQGAALLDAGCSQFITYIEDGMRIDRLIPKTAVMVINKEVPLQKGTQGKQFLISGFPKQVDSGAIADGFHSTVQMVSSHDADDASAVFSINNYFDSDRKVSIDLVIDGVEAETYSIQPNTKEVVLSLPPIKKGSLVSFHFVCEREESEIIGALENPQILECLTLKNFRINIPN
jgi:hypothetical protein